VKTPLEMSYWLPARRAVMETDRPTTSPKPSEDQPETDCVCVCVCVDLKHLYTSNII